MKLSSMLLNRREVLRGFISTVFLAGFPFRASNSRNFTITQRAQVQSTPDFAKQPSEYKIGRKYRYRYLASASLKIRRIDLNRRICSPNYSFKTNKNIEPAFEPQADSIFTISLQEKIKRDNEINQGFARLYAGPLPDILGFIIGGSFIKPRPIQGAIEMIQYTQKTIREKAFIHLLTEYHKDREKKESKDKNEPKELPLRIRVIDKNNRQNREIKKAETSERNSEKDKNEKPDREDSKGSIPAWGGPH